jgi:hypothetical protein
MKPGIFIIAVIIVIVMASCKKKEPVLDIVDFEELPLNSSGYWNGSDGSGGFKSGNITFVNRYFQQSRTWNGFAYTNHTDTVTKNISNQFTSIEGSGADNSVKYGVFFFSGVPDTMFFDSPELITDISVSNTVYSYYSMKNGSPSSKKFGGDSGNDQDWFKLRLTLINKDENQVGYIDVFLADFRYTDNSKDYIANAWTRLDLSTFGFVKAVIFEMSSSDSGTGGINNPPYVCIDYIKGELEVTAK